MTVVYQEEWGTDLSRKWFRTVILKFDDEAAAATFVDCAFPGYLKNKRFVTIVLDFIRTGVKIREQNCYRYVEYGPNHNATIVFSDDLLFVKAAW